MVKLPVFARMCAFLCAVAFPSVALAQGGITLALAGVVFKFTASYKFIYDDGPKSSCTLQAQWTGQFAMEGPMFSPMSWDQIPTALNTSGALDYRAVGRATASFSRTCGSSGTGTDDVFIDLKSGGIDGSYPFIRVDRIYLPNNSYVEEATWKITNFIGNGFTGTLVPLFAGESGSISVTISDPGPGTLAFSTPTNLPAGTVGSQYNGLVQVTGAGGTVLYQLTPDSDFPPGLNWISITAGTFGGKPTTTGVYSFTVKASELGTARNVSRTFTLPINNTGSGQVSPLQLQLNGLSSGLVGEPLKRSYSARGGTPPYKYVQVSGSLPPGVQIDSASGFLTGRPTSAGRWSFAIAAVDSRNATVSSPDSIQIEQVATAFDDPPLLCEGRLYSYQFKTVLPPCNAIHPPSQLLPGMALDPNSCTYFGTPTQTVFGGGNLLIQGSGLAPGYSSTFDPPMPQPNRQFYLDRYPFYDSVGPQVFDATVGYPMSGILNPANNTPSDKIQYTWTLVGGNLPDGIALSRDGVFAGIPTAAGIYNLTVSLTDGCHGPVNSGVTINVYADLRPGNLSITLTGLNAQMSQLVAGAAWTLQLLAAGTSSTSNWSLVPGRGFLPEGLWLTVDGRLSGTPQRPGDAPIVLQVSDPAANKFQTAAVTLKVAPPATPPQPRTAVGPALFQGYRGAFYSTQVAATGGIPPYRWSIASGSLPQGLSLERSSGIISGTPSESGSFNFNVRVADALGSEATFPYALHVAADITQSKVIQAPQSLSSGMLGWLYWDQLYALGGGADGWWKWVSGDRLEPFGLTMSPDGSITGTPTVTGTIRFRAQLVAGGDPQTGDFVISIYNPNSGPPAIFNSALEKATLGADYLADLEPLGGVPPYNWSIVDGSLPPGIDVDFDGYSAALTGNPQRTGVFSFTVRLEDSVGAVATRQLAIAVTSTSAAFTTPAHLGVLLVGDDASQYLPVLSGKAGNQDFSFWQIMAGSMPHGVLLQSDGSFSGQPSQPGVYNFYVFGRTSSGVGIVKRFQILVAPGVHASPIPTSADAGTAFFAALNTGGGAGPFLYEMTDGNDNQVTRSPVPGLSIDQYRGTLAGKPTVPGTYSFTIRLYPIFQWWIDEFYVTDPITITIR